MKNIPLILIALLSWLPWSGALAVVPDDLGGRIEAKVDGKPVTLPLLKTDIDADVQGDVARVTVTPPTCTGFINTHGVTAPVRPTLTSIDSTSVLASCAGNLCAIAQRGARET